MLGGDFDEYRDMVFLELCVDMRWHDSCDDLEDLHNYWGTCFVDYQLFLVYMYHIFQFVVYIQFYLILELYLSAG